MNRKALLATSVMALVGASVLPAQAGPAKPKAFKGSYTVKMNPDPTVQVASLGPDGATPVYNFGYGCKSFQASSVHKRALTIPGKGKLKVVLESPQAVPSNPAEIGQDWDMYLVSPGDDEVIDKSASPAAYEETNTTFTKATKIVIEVCNITGNPDAKVTYSYKPS